MQLKVAPRETVRKDSPRARARLSLVAPRWCTATDAPPPRYTVRVQLALEAVIRPVNAYLCVRAHELAQHR